MDSLALKDEHKILNQGIWIVIWISPSPPNPTPVRTHPQPSLAETGRQLMMRVERSGSTIPLRTTAYRMQ